MVRVSDWNGRSGHLVTGCWDWKRRTDFRSGRSLRGSVVRRKPTYSGRLHVHGGARTKLVYSIAAVKQLKSVEGFVGISVHMNVAIAGRRRFRIALSGPRDIVVASMTESLSIQTKVSEGAVIDRLLTGGYG